MRFQHEHNFTEAKGCLQLIDQLFVSLLDFFYLSFELLLNFNEIAHLALQSAHLGIFKFHFCLLKSVTYFHYLLLPFLVSLCRNVHVGSVLVVLKRLLMTNRLRERTLVPPHDNVVGDVKFADELVIQKLFSYL